ncbi:hypothetical protein NQ315_015205 [Exocentrus adspersus]|uniref:Uncharacterized protein n=1 Tax=Exocentrus adspersus TaxID=1586481 RepID=A0AAV8VX13_9CUCU|nr:hypothetical protein NQ315_015205 [Exocentrus adspersus]
MHLCASHAAEKLPGAIEDLARDIYAYFKNSSKRLLELKEFQQFLKIKPHKILKVSQTRWLSLQAVVDRILEQWEPLKLLFTRAALEDNLQSAKTILNALRNPLLVIVVGGGVEEFLWCQNRQKVVVVAINGHGGLSSGLWRAHVVDVAVACDVYL